jgi:hypothetical protein
VNDNIELELAHEFTFRASLNPPLNFGAGAVGMRMYFEVTGGHFVGERLNGTLVGGGGDWVVIGADGYGRIDVRLQFKTDDDAYILVQYPGLLEVNATVSAALASGGGTAYGDQYFRTTPRLETGDARYAWVNTSVFVARGHLAPGAVEYEVFRVV